MMPNTLSVMAGPSSRNGMRSKADPDWTWAIKPGHDESGGWWIWCAHGKPDESSITIGSCSVTGRFPHLGMAKGRLPTPRHRAHDELRRPKALGTLADLHRAKKAGPRVRIRLAPPASLSRITRGGWSARTR